MPETPSRKREATRIADAVKIGQTFGRSEVRAMLDDAEVIATCERNLKAAEDGVRRRRVMLKFAREIAPLDARARRMVAAGIGEE